MYVYYLILIPMNSIGAVRGAFQSLSECSRYSGSSNCRLVDTTPPKGNKQVNWPFLWYNQGPHSKKHRRRMKVCGLYLAVYFLQYHMQSGQCAQWDFLFLLWNDWATRCRSVGNVFIYYRQACWCAQLYPTIPIIPEWPFCIGATALQFMNV